MPEGTIFAQRRRYSHALWIRGALLLADALLRFDARAIFGRKVIAGTKAKGGGRRWYVGERIFVGQSEPHGNYFFELVGCDLCGSSTLDDAHRIRRRSDIPATPNVCRCWSCRRQTSTDDPARGASIV